MPAPTFTRPIQGTAPNQFVENTADVAALNATLEALWLAIVSGGSEEQIAELVDTLTGLRGAAQAAETGAVTAQGLAEAALAGVTTVAGSTGYQPDIATAEATLADDDVFWTVEVDEIVHYQIISGSAVEIQGARVPTSALVQSLFPIVVYSNIYSGVVYLAEDGSLADEQGGSTGGSGGSTTAAEPLDFVEGTGYEASPSIWMPSRSHTIDLWLGWGQSYANGAVEDPAYTTTAVHPGDVLMLNQGINPNGSVSTTFVDAVTNGFNEFPAVSAANYMATRFKAEFSETVRLVVASAHQGGRAYYRLKKGSTHWGYIQRILTDFRTIAQGMDLRPVLRGCMLMWGEADYAIPAWQAKGHIRQARQDLMDEARRLFGQDDEVKMVLYSPNRNHFGGSARPASWQIATRQLALEEPELFGVALATYGVITDDTQHPTVTGYRQLGVKMGQGALSLAYGTPRRPVDVTRAYWTSENVIRCEVYVPDGGDLIRDESGDLIGYPSDTSASNYIGPPPSGQESSGRDGGWWVKDKDGAFGVVSAVVSGTPGTLLRIDLTLSRAGHRGTTELMYATRSQSGSVAGSNDTGPRGIFRSSLSIAIPDGPAVFDWLIPQHHIL